MPSKEPDYSPDINSASRDELERLDAIDAETAEAIIRFRERHGRIDGPEALAHIPGVTAQAAEQIRRQVHFY